MPSIALFQMNSGINPDANCDAICDAIQGAADRGAAMLFAPEMCTLLDRDRGRASKLIVPEKNNAQIEQLREACLRRAIWCSLGSIPVLLDNGKFANRSIVLTDKGEVAARYDKLHMFDVDLDTGESWRESAAYQAGERVVTVETPVGKLGLTICYDIRFPALFEELGRQECDIISIPAAFTVPTGEAHWHVLQRARAIEATAFVVAAAQSGSHEDGRTTYGHSMVTDPWGKVIIDMKHTSGLAVVDVDLNRISEVRTQIPSLANKRAIPKSTVS